MTLQLNAAQRLRLTTLRRFMLEIESATDRGAAFRRVAHLTHFSVSRVQSMFYAWRDAGDIALVKKSALKKGKTCAASRLDITAEERLRLKRYAAQCGSRQYAIEHFADDGKTRPELRAFIKRYSLTRNYPKALLAAARVTAQEAALFRGDRAFQLQGHTQLRKLTHVDEGGVEHAMVGGDLFECDDMSLNQPFWYEWPYPSCPLSKAFGVRLGRQMLACVDSATGYWLGFDLIGRIRDAYRAEDVVRFLGRICQTHGLPRLGFRLERGIWMSKAVRGIKGVNDDDEKSVVASVTEAVDIEYVYSPKAKGVIEGSFDMLQTILALSGIQIGRKRGEFEKSTKLMLACADARQHPRDCGFPHISEAVERVNAAMDKANARMKMGRLLKGIPSEKFAEAITERPLIELADEQQHLFMPVKQIRPIDAGHVRLRVTHYDTLFSFAVPPHCVHLDEGYRLLVCFDPARPQLGAHIFDAESERRRDFETFQGQGYGVWDFAPDAPQIDRSGRRRKSPKAEHAAASKTSFRGLGLSVGTGASVEQIADGRGNFKTRANGIADPAAATQPAPAKHADALAEAALTARKRHEKRATSSAAAIATADRILRKATPATTA